VRIQKEPKMPKPVLRKKKGGKKHANSSSVAPVGDAQSSSKSKKEKKKKRGQRASTSVVELLKKNWDEGNIDLDEEHLNKVKQKLEQYDVGSARKKKEERKSQRKDPKSPRRVPNLTDKEDSPRVGSGNLAVEDIIASFHRELRYQREILDVMKNTVNSLRGQIYEEAEQTPQLSTKLQSEISTIRNEAVEDQLERNRIKNSVEGLQISIQQLKYDQIPPASSKHDKHDRLQQSAPTNAKKKKAVKGHEKKL